MKVKLHQLINPAAVKALDSLSAEASVPRKSIWPLVKTIATVMSELGLWEKTRNSLVLKYGQPSATDGSMLVPSANMSAFNTDIAAVLDADIDLPLIDPIELPVPLPDTSKLNANDVYVLMNMGLVIEKKIV